MIPRRLLPYLVIFLVLLGLYFGLTWRQARQAAKKAEAKKIFQVKEGEISGLALIRGKEEVRLAKKDGEWWLTKPLKMRADQAVVTSMLFTLASLNKERDLKGGPDLKAFGLDKPVLVVEFTAPGKSRRLVVGAATPGKMGFYAYRDQDPVNLLVISTGNKSSLDRNLAALRDKTIFAYAPDKAKSLLVKTGGATVQLEKVAPASWRWLGREKFPVRGDRVEGLLRFLHAARVRDFVADNPKDLAPYGLAPPLGEVVVLQDKEPERLMLGKKAKGGDYARKAPDGPVVLTDKDLLGHITKTLATLQDRRLWRGQAKAVQKVVWGTPGKNWVGLKDKDFFKITGPNKAEFKQPAVLLEVGLWKLQTLEFDRLAPPKAPPTRPLYVLELIGAKGKPLFRLEELAQVKAKEVLLRVKVGEKTETGLVRQKTYQDWQKEMARLTSPPPGAKTAPAPKSKPGI
jgi:hypothetical protein